MLRYVVNLWCDKDENGCEISQESKTSNHTEEDSLHKPTESKPNKKEIQYNFIKLNEQIINVINFSKITNALPFQHFALLNYTKCYAIVMSHDTHLTRVCLQISLNLKGQI